MSDDTDASQKTEEPTPKKVQDAREKGQIATSREINHWFMLLAASIIFAVLADSLTGDIARTLVKFVARPDTLPVDADGLESIFSSTFYEIGIALLPTTIILVLAAAASGFMQTGFVASLDRIQPKLEKISILKGAKRMFSMKAVVEFAKGVLKIAIVGSIATPSISMPRGPLASKAGTAVVGVSRMSMSRKSSATSNSSCSLRRMKRA
jgi:flagellar biosynthetic protein FlhB